MSHSNHVSNKFLLAFYGLQVIFYLLRQLKVSVCRFLLCTINYCIVVWSFVFLGAVTNVILRSTGFQVENISSR